VVLLLTAGGLAVGRPRATPPPLTQPSPSTSSPTWYGERPVQPRVGTGDAVDVVAAAGWFYVVEGSPGTVLRLDGVAFAAAASAGVPDQPQGLAVDPAADRLWVWHSTPTGATSAREYVASTLAPLRDVPVGDAQVFQGVALDGELWLATAHGMYRVGASDTAAQAVSGHPDQVYSLTVDRSRHRLLLVYAGRVQALDPATLEVRDGAALPLIKESVAVVAGRVWVGGYALTEAPRIYRLDPDTLQVAGTSEVNEQVGPGAILSGGVESLWVRDGADEGMSCLDPATGAIRQQWRTGAETVASLPRVAVGVNGRNLVQLVLTGDCPG
jgi:DNA-binding beta-propeller fold protein YncE